MASETAKAKARLANLDASLDELSDALEPLFEQTLPESLIALDPIQQAKLQTVLPYIVYDLVFSELLAIISKTSLQYVDQ
jgi:exosome complex protein LRP1